ncbi:helix-turn-helix transcriptional regulator [Chthonobacter albigriseus]|uniref:helix-turn-helix transcriptional regulator n=1 Tax=Chthonobacter albigriseus TaxID=1683161 RepID=UPI0015EF7684|nr:helix-turn-helix domain-containing protein [Chthonobacter albigriseus]
MTKSEAFALRINDAASFIGVSRWKIYDLAKENKLSIRKVGGRSVILRADLERLVSGGPLK